VFAFARNVLGKQRTGQLERLGRVDAAGVTTSRRLIVPVVTVPVLSSPTAST
jgi:hypothetical protein